MNPLPPLLPCLLWLCAACAAPDNASLHPLQGQPAASIYVVNQGWHAGLILRRADIPPGDLPESADFPDSDYLELGWGDRDYYQSDDPGLWLTLKAAFWPTASVLYVAAIKGHVAARYGGYEWVRLDLAPASFARLVDYVDRSFDRNGAAKSVPITQGHYRESFFYAAHGTFHIFHTCNGWIAGALKAGGIPLGGFEPVTSDQLLARIRPFAACASDTDDCAPRHPDAVWP